MKLEFQRQNLWFIRIESTEIVWAYSVEALIRVIPCEHCHSRLNRDKIGNRVTQPLLPALINAPFVEPRIQTAVISHLATTHRYTPTHTQPGQPNSSVRRVFRPKQTNGPVSRLDRSTPLFTRRCMYTHGRARAPHSPAAV